ncbi:USP6 N-terminal-like protein [Balamuthia mandrillaris]
MSESSSSSTEEETRVKEEKADEKQTPETMEPSAKPSALREKRGRSNSASHHKAARSGSSSPIDYMHSQEAASLDRNASSSSLKGGEKGDKGERKAKTKSRVGKEKSDKHKFNSLSGPPPGHRVAPNSARKKNNSTSTTPRDLKDRDGHHLSSSANTSSRSINRKMSADNEVEPASSGRSNTNNRRKMHKRAMSSGSDLRSRISASAVHPHRRAVKREENNSASLVFYSGTHNFGLGSSKQRKKDVLSNASDRRQPHLSKATRTRRRRGSASDAPSRVENSDAVGMSSGRLRVGSHSRPNTHRPSSNQDKVDEAEGDDSKPSASTSSSTLSTTLVGKTLTRKTSFAASPRHYSKDKVEAEKRAKRAATQAALPVALTKHERRMHHRSRSLGGMDLTALGSNGEPRFLGEEDETGGERRGGSKLGRSVTTIIPSSGPNSARKSAKEKDKGHSRHHKNRRKPNKSTISGSSRGRVKPVRSKTLSPLYQAMAEGDWDAFADILATILNDKALQDSGSNTKNSSKEQNEASSSASASTVAQEGAEGDSKANAGEQLDEVDKAISNLVFANLDMTSKKSRRHTVIALSTSSEHNNVRQAVEVLQIKREEKATESTDGQPEQSSSTVTSVAEKKEDDKASRDAAVAAGMKPPSSASAPILRRAETTPKVERGNSAAQKARARDREEQQRREKKAEQRSSRPGMDLLSNQYFLLQTDKHGRTPLHWACSMPKKMGAKRDVLIEQLMDATVMRVLSQKLSIHGDASHHADVYPFFTPRLDRRGLHGDKDAGDLSRFVNKRTRGQGETALHVAVRHDFRMAVEQLLRKGHADPNATDRKGRTALHLAARKGYNDCCLALFFHGPASLDCLDKRGNDPAAVAKKHGHMDCYSVIMQEGGNVLREYRRAAAALASTTEAKAVMHQDAYDDDDKAEEKEEDLDKVQSLAHSSTAVALTQTRGDKLGEAEGEAEKNGEVATEPEYDAFGWLIRPSVQSSSSASSEGGSSTSGTKVSGDSVEKENESIKRKIGNVLRFHRSHSALDNSKAVRKQPDKKLRKRVKSWEDILLKWDVLQSSPQGRIKIRRACRKGIPHSVRGRVWLRIGQVELRKRQARYQYSHRNFYMLQDARGSRFIKQIDLDVVRTFQNHIMFRQRFAPKQVALFNVLQTYSIYNSLVGYTQGMSSIVAILLMHIDSEEDVFWMLDVLMKDFGLMDVLRPGFPALKEAFYTLDQLIHYFLPQLAKHMDDEKLETSHYSTRWFMTLFLDLQYLTAMQLWDFMFSDEHRNNHYFIAIAILKTLQDELLGLDFDKMAQLLTTLENKELDAEELIGKALKLRKKLEKEQRHLLATIRTEYKAFSAMEEKKTYEQELKRREKDVAAGKSKWLALLKGGGSKPLGCKLKENEKGKEKEKDEDYFPNMDPSKKPENRPGRSGTEGLFEHMSLGAKAIMNGTYLHERSRNSSTNSNINKASSSSSLSLASKEDTSNATSTGEEKLQIRSTGHQLCKDAEEDMTTATTTPTMMSEKETERSDTGKEEKEYVDKSLQSFLQESNKLDDSERPILVESFLQSDSEGEGDGDEKQGGEKTGRAEQAPVSEDSHEDAEDEVVIAMVMVDDESEMEG